MSAYSLLELDDRRILSMLQIDGRLSAVRIARALDLPERSVTRRLNRLLDSGVAKIVLPPPVPDLDTVTVILRLRVLRGKVMDIAMALASRSDVQFVDIMEGGQEIVATSNSNTSTAATRLLEEIGSSGSVVELTSHTGLHRYADPSSWTLGALTSNELAAITPPPALQGVELDDEDRALLRGWSSNARLSIAAVAGRASIPLSTARRRVEKLSAGGYLRAATLVDRHAVGLSIEANLSLSVRPGAIQQVGEVLARAPGVHGAAATTGSPNMFVAVYCSTLSDLHLFITNTLGPLPIDSTEVNLVAIPIKQAGALVPRA